MTGWQTLVRQSIPAWSTRRKPCSMHPHKAARCRPRLAGRMPCESQASPSPTYISTCEQKDWPLDSHLKHVPATPQPPLVLDLDTKADHVDPSHPHYPSPHYTPHLPPRLSPHRKYSCIPWLIATFFLLTTLFLASVILGVHFFDLTHPAAPAPQIHVFVEGRLLEERGSGFDDPDRMWSIVTPGRSTGTLYTTTRTRQGLSIPTAIVAESESSTGRLHTAPTDAPGPGDGAEIKRRDGFITLLK
ncbi:hypothetical protein IQ06DRAFT_27377 [Phaeosphaeriaceae sp. SRC1lsM3a]|nr:hypothetical protein IQ06DRAFT_27377 [Stagonospora sp. SRC1lsM3a]